MTSTRKYLRITITGESYDDLLLSLDTVRYYVSREGRGSTGSFDESDYEYKVTEEAYTPIDYV
jgi:hypothetical protein